MKENIKKILPSIILSLIGFTLFRVNINLRPVTIKDKSTQLQQGKKEERPVVIYQNIIKAEPLFTNEGLNKQSSVITDQNPDFIIEEKSYLNQKIAQNTIDTICHRVNKFTRKITDNIEYFESFGDAKFELHMKLNGLREILSALDYIEEYKYELKTKVSDNPNIELALNYLKNKQCFQEEYNNISKKLTY